MENKQSTLNQWIKEVKRRIIKFFETYENENITYQILWDAENTMPKWKFIGKNVYIIKEKQSWINNLTLYIKKW